MTRRSRQLNDPMFSEEAGFERLIDSLSLADHMYFGVLSCRELHDGKLILGHIQEGLRHLLRKNITIHHLRHPPGNPFKSGHLTQEMIDPLLDEFKDAGYQLFVIDALWEETKRVSSEGARFFRRLNELRNKIMDRLPGPLLLLTTTDLAISFAREAPDFWSVRSVWEELQGPVAESKPSLKETDHKNLAETLERAYLSRVEKLIEGRDRSELGRQIRHLKRRLRDGGTFRAGVLLGDRYRLIQHIRSGGFVTIWKAFDQEESQVVAVTILHWQYSQDRTRRQRFFRGARKMAKLNHPNIVAVIEEQCEDHGTFYFVMEYARGGNLEEKVRRDGPLPLEETVRIILDIGDGLTHAHSRDLIHRDVNPSNVLFTKDGRAKLTDFDLVPALDATGGTRTGGLGTFLYAAPELMAEAKSVGPQADVYGLAMTTLFVLKGKLDYGVARYPELTVGKLGVSEKVKKALAKGLSWDLKQRFDTVTSFCEAIQKGRSSSAGRWQTHPWVMDDEPCPPRNTTPPAEPGLLARESSWVPLPPGSFTMGDHSSGSSWEQPAHSVKITSFLYLSRMPMTHRAYGLFLESGGYDQRSFWCEEGWQWLHLNEADFESWYNEKKADVHHYFIVSPESYRPGKEPRFWTDSNFNRDTQPVVGVNWFEAMAFCRWLSESLKKAALSWLPKKFRVRLLTEAEWEYAATGCQGRAYPWGDAEPDADLANFGAKIGKTTPVDTCPKGSTPEGCMDMAGNVWEWCLDHWDPFVYKTRKSLSIDPMVKNDFPAHVLRGGSWDELVLSLRCSARRGLLVATRDKYFGFRCCIVSSG